MSILRRMRRGIQRRKGKAQDLDRYQSYAENERQQGRQPKSRRVWLEKEAKQ